MEYGHTTDISNVDFTLPQDDSSNATYLNTLPSSQADIRFHIGCAKWGIKEWVGPLYPKGTKENQYLEEYGKHFNSVELNTTGYRFGSARQMKEWADKTPDGFSFSPKFPQPITQFKLLGDVQEATDRFVESLSGFGTKLGRPFLLMPDRFTPARMDKLESFFEKIPPGFPVSFELRHPEFYSESGKQRVTEILRKHHTPWIITDSAGERGVIHMVITSPTVFIRFSGCDHPETDKRRMNSWVDRLLQWKELGVKEVYWYAHNIPEEKTPLYAAYFIRQLNLQLKMNIHAPDVPEF